MKIFWFFNILAARTFLTIRNLCGSLCAIGVSFFLWIYADEMAASSLKNNETSECNNEDASKDDSMNTTQTPLIQVPFFETAKFATIVGVIVFSSIIRLASSGTIIIIQKDLIVVISNNDNDHLSSK